jgi:Tol biopolymer transport system component
VTAKLVAGGMGEVYRATDSKLGRDVALKVLPEAFARDAERMQRFQREAQVLASLNHPHIAAIHGLEHQDQVQALAMELVEGPTLAERINQGAIPLEEALPITRQMAEALEYAHEKGIIHRDLKPANIKITADGKVKVLDFGLAKALSEETTTQDISHSPTLSMAATKAGIILGTAAYMSPEQAKGKSADRRADIWAFGVVFYEMLTGQQLYTGETVSEVLAHVITKSPTLEVLPGDTPARVRRLLERCLTRDPKLRLQAIGEARIAIDQVIAQPVDEVATAAAAGIPVLPAELPVWRRMLPWAVAGLGIVVAGLAAWAPWRPAPAPPLSTRLSVEVGAPVSLMVGGQSGAIISPDGTRFAYSALDANQRRQIYVRAHDQLTATPLSGTDGARDIFFSPDGQWIGFFADNKLKKISTQGGAAVTLCDAPTARGGWWADDGTIVLAAGNRDPLVRVSESGGTPQPITKLDPARVEVTHRWPQVLPGSKAILFTAHTAGNGFDDSHIIVQNLKSGERKTLHQGGFHARYLPSGHVVYAFKGTLFGIPFDLDRLEATGPPAPFQERVVTSSGGAGAQFAFSNTGTFLYVPGEDRAGAVLLQWMDRAGKFTPLRAQPADYTNQRFSPDGKRLALVVNTGGESDIWIYEWERDTMTRFTFEPGFDGNPVWSPDGRRIAFSSERGGTRGIYWQRADGTGEIQRLVESKNAVSPHSFSPDGKLLAYTESDPKTLGDIWLLPVEGDEKSEWKPGKARVFLNSPTWEIWPRISPDGRWLAYVSLESTQPEVYVRPLSGSGGKWQVSNAGGVMPKWAKNGKELFFRTVDESRIMVATYRATGESFQADKPSLWSEGRFLTRGTSVNFDLAPDGNRFAVLRLPESEQVDANRIDKFVLVMNAFEELRRRVPAGKK